MRLFLGVFQFLRDYPLCHKLRLNIVHPPRYFRCEIMPPGV